MLLIKPKQKILLALKKDINGPYGFKALPVGEEEKVKAVFEFESLTNEEFALITSMIDNLADDFQSNLVAAHNLLQTYVKQIHNIEATPSMITWEYLFPLILGLVEACELSKDDIYFLDSASTDI